MIPGRIIPGMLLSPFGQECRLNLVLTGKPELILEQRGRKLLVVDDDPGIRLLCSNVLDSFDVTQATDGLEALELIRERPAVSLDGETVFTAGLAGRRLPLTARTLLGATIRYPLVTFKVMAAIHWEAAKLWLKGARYRKRPQAPVEEVSVSTRMAA